MFALELYSGPECIFDLYNSSKKSSSLVIFDSRLWKAWGLNWSPILRSILCSIGCTHQYHCMNGKIPFTQTARTYFSFYWMQAPSFKEKGDLESPRCWNYGSYGSYLPPHVNLMRIEYSGKQEETLNNPRRLVSSRDWFILSYKSPREEVGPTKWLGGL